MKADSRTWSRIWSYVLAFLSVMAYGGIAYGIHRAQFFYLVSFYALAYLAYLFFLRPTSRGSFHINYWIYLAIFFRLVFLFSVPVLSDDFYRFFWDGKLLAQGHNPYLYLPRQLIENGRATSLGLSQALFENLNSPEYYTVYPPVNQLFFAISAFIFPENILGAIVIMRLIIIGAEIGTLWLLRKLLHTFHLPDYLLLIYALNPLVIVELTGNLHFEAVVLFFFLSALYILLVFSVKDPAKVHASFSFGTNGQAHVYTLNWRSLLASALSYALAIATKLIPLIFLPIFLRKFNPRMAIRYYVLIGFLTVLMFLPFFDPVLFENIFASVGLYFHSFEFNASIYYLVRWYGYQVYGYNIIASSGANLSLLAFLGILLIAWVNKPRTWQLFLTKCLFMLSTYYFLATTVHPWYICTLVLFSVFSPYRFAIVWSGVVIFSYATYQSASYQENLYLVSLEYTLVYSWLLYELAVPLYNKYSLAS